MDWVVVTYYAVFGGIVAGNSAYAFRKRSHAGQFMSALLAGDYATSWFIQMFTHLPLRPVLASAVCLGIMYLFYRNRGLFEPHPRARLVFLVTYAVTILCNLFHLKGAFEPFPYYTTLTMLFLGLVWVNLGVSRGYGMAMDNLGGDDTVHIRRSVPTHMGR